MRYDNTPASNKACGDGAWIYGPDTTADDRYNEAFDKWCDRAQVAIALRDLYSANKIDFDTLIDLASYTASDFGRIAGTSATDERPTAELWAVETDLLTEKLHSNFDRYCEWLAAP